MWAPVTMPLMEPLPYARKEPSTPVGRRVAMSLGVLLVVVGGIAILSCISIVLAALSAVSAEAPSLLWLGARFVVGLMLAGVGVALCVSRKAGNSR